MLFFFLIIGYTKCIDLQKASVEMELKKPLKVRCQNCGRIFEIDVEFECVSTNERDLGTELDYEGVHEGMCPGCNKDIYIKIESYEYPAGKVYLSGVQELDGVVIQEDFELESCR